MCKYCNANVLEDLAINKKDEAVIINQNIETNEYFIDGFETEIPINYCPMCRKGVRKMNLDNNKPVNNIINYAIVFYKEKNKTKYMGK